MESSLHSLRIHGKTYGVIAALFALLAFLWSNSYLYLVGPSFTWKMVVIIALFYLFCSALYKEPTPLYRLFFVVLWYLMHYLYSIILTTLPAFLLGISYQEFREFRYAGYYILAAAIFLLLRCALVPNGALPSPFGSFTGAGGKPCTPGS